jgi:glycosyltransferase involved in cell wall biosynthesis
MVTARRRRILLISYLFPPAGGIGVQRALSLARYLPDCGYEVHVLQAKNAAAPVNDPELLSRVPVSVVVHHAFTPEIPFTLRQQLWKKLSGRSEAIDIKASTQKPPRWKTLLSGMVKRVLSPEPEILWVPFALRRARQIVRRHGIEIVLVTAPPFSAFLVGNGLKKRFPDLRFISDFRDEWLQFYLSTFEFQNSEYTRKRAATIERETVELSDRVVAVTATSLATIRARYPDQPDDKFALVANGYDPEIFAGFAPRRHNQPGIVVTHAGTAYKTASPRYYLDALDAMPDEIRSQIETRFIGRISESERRDLQARQSVVKLVGFLPQSQALRYLEETDYLLLTMTDTISLPGKLFEYLATGKPILAISPRGGEVDRIIEETQSGWCAPPDDPLAIQAMLRRAYEESRGGRSALRPNRERIRRYERPRLAAEYARLMDRVFEPAASVTVPQDLQGPH